MVSEVLLFLCPDPDLNISVVGMIVFIQDPKIAQMRMRRVKSQYSIYLGLLPQERVHVFQVWLVIKLIEKDKCADVWLHEWQCFFRSTFSLVLSICREFVIAVHSCFLLQIALSFVCYQGYCRVELIKFGQLACWPLFLQEKESC